MLKKTIFTILMFPIMCLGNNFPSNLQAVNEIFVNFNSPERDLVLNFAKLVADGRLISDGKNPQLNVITGANQLPKLQALLQPLHGKAFYKDIKVHVSSQDTDVLGGADWVQDTGEFFHSNGQISLFRHESRNTLVDELFLELLRKRKTPITTVKSKTGFEGGNIEATPWGQVYVGSEFGEENLKELKKLVGKDSVFVVPTDFSSISHVDESYQFIPVSPSISQCGYGLVYADLLEGLRLAISNDWLDSTDYGRTESDRVLSSADYLRSISYFTGVSIEDIKLTPEGFSKLLYAFDASITPQPFGSLFGFRSEDIYVYKVFEAALKIHSGLKKFKENADTYDSCPDLKLVGLPELWTPGFNGGLPAFPESVELVLETRTSNLTAFTNMVVLNDYIIIPDAKAPPQLLHFIESDKWDSAGKYLRKNVKDRLAAVGIKEDHLLFVNMSSAILGDGAAHCKSNVVRSNY